MLPNQCALTVGKLSDTHRLDGIDRGQGRRFWVILCHDLGLQVDYKFCDSNVPEALIYVPPTEAYFRYALV